MILFKSDEFWCYNFLFVLQSQYFKVKVSCEDKETVPITGPEHQNSGPDAVEVSLASSQAGTPGERDNRRKGGGEEQP